MRREHPIRVVAEGLLIVAALTVLLVLEISHARPERLPISPSHKIH